MADRLHVHVPYRTLEASLGFLLKRRLQPEIAFRGPELEAVNPAVLAGWGERLSGAGLGVTVHAPFHDLNPGALEPLVLDATRRRFRQTLAAAAALRARLVVFHPGYDPWKYGGQDQLWLEQSLVFWPPLLDAAGEAGLMIALENIFETRPDTLAGLLEAIDRPDFGHCFDVGHWNLFAARTSLEDWFARLAGRLLHLHLHDNRGLADEHLPVGEGEIDFAALFRRLQGLSPPPSLTLEAHDRPHLERSLAAVRPFLAP